MKKYLLNRFMSLMTMVMMAVAFTGCSDDKQDPDKGTNTGISFFIEEENLYKSIGKNGGKIEIPIQTKFDKTEWRVSYDVNWITAVQSSTINNQATLTLTIKSNDDKKRQAIVKVSSLTRSYDITISQFGVNDVAVEGDIPVKVIGGTASSVQSGSGEFEYSYDDDPNTMYHSHWTNTRFPVTLQYYFSGSETIDYLDYVPRMGGGNGSFGKLSISVATDAARKEFTPVGDYDFGETANTTRVNFENPVKATAVKFEVKSGYANFASCAEMKFWRKNTDKTLDKELLTVFTDLTCSELKPGVSDEAIESLSSDFFVDLANTLRNGTYDPIEKMIRVHEYEAYSDPVEWSGTLMTKIYSNLDNPMGIHVQKGKKLVVCVGPTYGNNLSIMCVGEHQPTNADDYAIPDSSGPTYMLSEGVNVLEMTSAGQLFLLYTANPSSPKIKIHIPTGDNGEIAGYFDLKEHKTDEMYKKIVAKSNHKYFVVKGDRMMFMFHRNKLNCSSLVNAIQTWDQIVKWQQDFMGIDDVRPAQWNNHLMGVSMEGAYMWASNWRMGFVVSSLTNILEYDNLMSAEDNAWGPSHEMGHVNQMAINWASTTESSNNLFSNYVLYRFGKYKSRGKGLMYRFEDVYVNGEAWPLMGLNGDVYQGEDTEIHMRMNWQLWNYYHRVMGDETFFARVFKNMRAVGLNETEDPGRKSVEFAKACSDAAGEDLTDFFTAWGILKPVDTKVDSYGTYNYVVSTSQINAAKEYMSKYPKPKHALEYIEDRAKSEFQSSDYRYNTVGDVGYYTTYEQNLKLSAAISASVSGKNVTITNGKEAVAFEIRAINADDSYGEIRWASNFLSFTIPAAIKTSGAALYAVQADGTRKLLARL